MKKFLSMVMALAMTLTLVTVGASAKDFTDKSTINYDEAVGVISGIGVVDGYTNGSFNPTATLTRGAAAKIICNLLLGPTAASALGVTSAPFKDVPVSNVFAGYIAYCSTQGIINGYGNGYFQPAATVTGFQFLKMLLGALGYDGSIEGFTGTNWAVNVAKLAITTSLTKGNDNFVGSKAMTREEAALYAFNTLKATMVYYPSKGTTISTSDGTTIVTGAVAATKMTADSSSGYKTGAGATNDGYLQFCEQYFSKLKLDVGTSTDAFGKPASVWEYKSTEIGKYADTPVATFTTATKASAVASALKGYSLPLGGSSYVKVENDTTYTTSGSPATKFDTSAIVVNNGSNTAVVLPVAASANQTTAAALAALTKNGTLVQVFADDNKDITAIVVVQYTVGKVSNVVTSSSKTSYTITNGGSGIDYSSDSASSDTINLAGSIAKNDYVTFVKIGSVSYVYPTSVVTGTQTSKTYDDVITVNGTGYTIGTGLTNVASSDFTNGTKSATYYVDQYGCVVNTTATAAYGDYAYIVGTYGKVSSSVDGNVPTAQVKAVLADGTVGTYDLKLHKLTSSDVADGATYDNVATGTTAAVTGVGSGTHTTFAVGDYVIDGTLIRVYDSAADSSINTTANIQTAIAALGKVVGYSVSSTTMTVQKLSGASASMTGSDTYLFTGTDSTFGYKKTSATDGTATALINSSAIYVIYDDDTSAAAVYTGNTGLPSSVTALSTTDSKAYAVIKAAGTSDATNIATGTASVIFATVTNGVGATSTENYVYIDSAKYTTSLDSSSNTVYSYTGYKADGTTVTVTATSSNKLSSAGIYTYDTDNTVKDSYLKTTGADGVMANGYAYGSALSLSNSLLGVGSNYYNVTDDTQTYYVSSDATQVDGNKGYVVLERNSNGVTSNVAAIFVTGVN